MNNIKRYYEILGLKPGASRAEVKQAYRTLAKTWHPDRFQDNPHLKQQAEVKIKRLNEAYQTVKAWQPPPMPTVAPSSPTIRVSQGADTKASHAETYYQRGQAAFRRELDKEALADLSLAIRLNPQHLEAYRLRGVVRSRLGLEFAAADDHRKVVELESASRSTPLREPTAASPDALDAEFFDRTETTVPDPPGNPSAAGEIPLPSETVAPWHCEPTLSGHADAVTCLELSPDGKLLASGSRDATIALWNWRTGKRFCTLEAHTEPITAIALSQDSQLLASASEDCTVKLWHLRSGTLLRTFAGHSDDVTAVALLSDRQTLISASRDGFVKHWHLNGSLIRTLHQTEPVLSLCHQGQTLILCDRAQTLTRWHLRTRELVRTITRESTGAIALSPDGQWLAFSSAGAIRIWCLKTDTIKFRFAPVLDLRSLCFSPDSQTLVSTGTDHMLRFWSLESSQLLYALEVPAVRGAIFAPAGDRLISAQADGTIGRWRR